MNRTHAAHTHARTHTKHTQSTRGRCTRRKKTKHTYTGMLRKLPEARPGKLSPLSRRRYSYVKNTQKAPPLPVAKQGGSSCGPMAAHYRGKRLPLLYERPLSSPHQGIHLSHRGSSLAAKAIPIGSKQRFHSVETPPNYNLEACDEHLRSINVGTARPSLRARRGTAAFTPFIGLCGCSLSR